MYRLHTEVQVSTRLHYRGPQWCKTSREQTEVCNQLVPWPMIQYNYTMATLA